MSKPDTWMPLYIGDYLADTAHLTLEESGAYLHIIMAYWRNGGPLPNDPKRMAAICKCTPKKWKMVFPSVAPFFEISESEWRHKRIDQELSSATEKSNKNKERAEKAAAARWGQLDASSNASSNAQAQLKECPSPSPSPNTKPPVNNTGEQIRSPVSETAVAPPRENPPPSIAGLACKAIREAGIADTNPSHPTLAALLDAGATVQEFADAARECVARDKLNFAYVIGMVKGRRERAARLVLATGAMPQAPPHGETARDRKRRETYEALTGQKAKQADEPRDITSIATRVG